MGKTRDIDPPFMEIINQNPWLLTGKVPDHLVPSTERPLGKHLWNYILK